MKFSKRLTVVATEGGLHSVRAIYFTVIKDFEAFARNHGGFYTQDGKGLETLRKDWEKLCAKRAYHKLTTGRDMFFCTLIPFKIRKHIV